jgi:CRISPR/Cas system CMR subunit Cmr6 (Cas7 group RAMP superfamily)
MNNANNNQINITTNGNSNHKSKKHHHHHQSKKVSHTEKNQMNNKQENIQNNFQKIQKSPKNKKITCLISEDFKIPSSPSILDFKPKEDSFIHSSEDEAIEYLTIPFQFNLTNK